MLSGDAEMNESTQAKHLDHAFAELSVGSALFTR
jgi:hypothetical protein